MSERRDDPPPKPAVKVRPRAKRGRPGATPPKPVERAVPEPSEKRKETR